MVNAQWMMVIFNGAKRLASTARQLVPTLLGKQGITRSQRACSIIDYCDCGADRAADWLVIGDKFERKGA